MNAYLQMMLKAARSLLGDFTVKVDREKRTVQFIQGVKISELTYDQVIDLMEKIFNEDPDGLGPAD